MSHRRSKAALFGAAVLTLSVASAAGCHSSDRQPPAAGPVPAVRETGSGERELDNIYAFARLLGYVRYFHPSDAAAGTDWNRFAVDGMRAVEKAESRERLARELTDLLAPIAPSVHIYPTGTAPPPMPPAPAGRVRIVTWEHIGIQSEDPAKIYTSTRIFKTPAEAARKNFPDPLHPFLADLGSGLSASIPLALFADESGALPRTVVPAGPASELSSYSVSDSATRFAIVALGWNIIQHSYPYFDVTPVDWPAVLKTTLREAAADSDADAFLDTLRGMMAALRDGHGSAFDEKNRFTGTVRVRWMWIDNQLIVSQVLADSARPLRPGDAVLTIDGKPAGEVLKREESLTSGATPQWVRYRALAAMIFCNKDRLALEIEPYAERGTRRSVSVECDSRNPTSQPPVSISQKQPVAEVEPGIVYVDLARISAADLAAAMPRLSKAHGLVFDMRGYPHTELRDFIAHLSKTTLSSAQWNVPLITRPDHEFTQFQRGGEWVIEPKEPYLAARRAFITDGREVSYAESIMGIVENYRLGDIVGGPTAGTNGNVNKISLPAGFALSWTGMKVLKHDGSRHHGIGVLPTLPVTATRDGIAAGRDELLDRAVQAVKNPAP